MEPEMKQLGFLDFDIRLHRIDKAGDPFPVFLDCMQPARSLMLPLSGVSEKI